MSPGVARSASAQGSPAAARNMHVKFAPGEVTDPKAALWALSTPKLDRRTLPGSAAVIFRPADFRAGKRFLADAYSWDGIRPL